MKIVVVIMDKDDGIGFRFNVKQFPIMYLFYCIWLWALIKSKNFPFNFIYFVYEHAKIAS